MALFKLPAVLMYYLRQWWVRFNLRRRGIRLGNSVAVKGHCQIDGKVEIGSNVIIQSAIIDGRGGVTIGSNVIIDQATIITAQHDIDSPTYPVEYNQVEIGDYAILYYHSTILPGCKVGKGAVVGAGAIVAHDVPDMAVVVGNPARIIRSRKDIHSECDINVMGGFGIRKRLMRELEKLFSKQE